MPEAIGQEQEPYRHKWLILFTTSLALFMLLLDATVVNISVPSFIGELHATLPQAEWVLNAYTLTFAALLISFGRLGDMYGHRRMFILGMSIFGFGSLMCGLAPTIETLIAFRVIQASGSAFMLPATLSITTVSFPPEQRGRALGVWGAVSGVALGVGPALGGFLTQYDWRYIFFINLPVVLFAIPLTVLVIGVRKPTQRHRVDLIGVVLTVACLTAFNYAMIGGRPRGGGIPSSSTSWWPPPSCWRSSSGGRAEPPNHSCGSICSETPPSPSATSPLRCFCSPCSGCSS